MNRIVCSSAPVGLDVVYWRNWWSKGCRFACSSTSARPIVAPAEPDLVHVEVHGLRMDAQSHDAGLLGGLTGRGGEERVVAGFPVAAEVEPPMCLAVQVQQDGVQLGRQDERARGQMAGRAGTPQPVGVPLEVGDEAVTQRGLGRRRRGPRAECGERRGVSAHSSRGPSGVPSAPPMRRSVSTTSN